MDFIPDFDVRGIPASEQAAFSQFVESPAMYGRKVDVDFYGADFPTESQWPQRGSGINFSPDGTLSRMSATWQHELLPEPSFASEVSFYWGNPEAWTERFTNKRFAK